MEIIKKGLPLEERKKILKKFPPPENCTLMDPPKLNLEVKAVVDNTIVKRDERIIEKQEKIVASLAALGRTIDLMLTLNPPDRAKYLEPLNFVMRLLTDLLHDETEIRRNLILKNIKASFKDVLKDLPPDSFLFGSNLSEKIKAAKVLKNSTKDLVIPQRSNSEKEKNSKNYSGPPLRKSFRRNFNSRGGGQTRPYSRGHRQFPRNKVPYTKRNQPE